MHRWYMNVRRMCSSWTSWARARCKFRPFIFTWMSKRKQIADRTGETRASPRLKDAEIPEDRLPDLYAEMIIATRRMYQHCHLVHADLSEYNIL